MGHDMSVLQGCFETAERAVPDVFCLSGGVDVTAPTLEVAFELSGGLASALRALELFAPFEELLLESSMTAGGPHGDMQLTLTVRASDRASLIISKIEATPYYLAHEIR